MPPPSLHHLVLGAQDVEQLSAFYRDGLGCPEVTRHHASDGTLRSVWLQLEPGVLMIEHAQAARGPRAEREAGWCLLCLRVEADALEATAARWKQAGAVEDGRTEHTLCFRDPEGHRFACSSYPL